MTCIYVVWFALHLCQLLFLVPCEWHLNPSIITQLFEPTGNNIDLSWEWNSLKDLNNKKHVTCDYCGKTTTDGITRAKEHQMGTRENVRKCLKTPKSYCVNPFRLVHFSVYFTPPSVGSVGSLNFIEDVFPSGSLPSSPSPLSSMSFESPLSTQLSALFVTRSHSTSAGKSGSILNSVV
ncbi:hypothetical protein RJT34_16727 [Clitoria ternatea]|uniref:BED-type domain-containing protein n=1 Tax=Clitoria ternatea TaxID=43366 RepID=A0AAN9J7L8_CLITE